MAKPVIDSKAIYLPYQNSDPASPFRCLAGSIAPARSRARAAIGFMVWLWISAVIVLLGGELSAEMEHQTARDTTTGSPKPIGERGARVADTVGAAQRAR